MPVGADAQVSVDLLARDRSGPATKSFSDNLDDVADSADKASKSTGKLGESTDKAAARIKKMDHEIAVVRQNLAFLHEGMGDATDQAERLDISKGIRKAEADLKRLTKSRDALKDLLPDPGPATKNFVQQLGAGLSSQASGLAAKAGSSLGPTIGIAVGAAAAPTLLSAMSSALSAGAGAGVLGVGVAAAIAGDTRLQQAGQQIVSRLSQGMQSVAQRALGDRLLGVFGDLSSASDRIVSKMGVAFSQLGPFLRPFIRDVTAAGEAVIGSLLSAAAKSGPALEAMGQSVRLVADGVADFVGVVADGGPEAASNLRLIAGVTGDVVRQTGLLIKVFADLADSPIGTSPLMQLLKKHYNDIAAGQKDVGDSAPMAADGIGAIGTVAAEAAPPIQTAADALHDFATESQNVFDTETSVQDAMAKAAKAVQENGRGLDQWTAKGRENREALSNVATQLNRNYEATLKLNGEGPMTDAVAKRNVNSFVAMATKMTGSRNAAIELANKLLAIPDVTRKVTINGLSAAKQTAANINATLGAIRDRTVHINYTTTTGANSSALRAAYNKNAREFGGPVKARNAYVVGEKRPEVFVPNEDGHIIPSVDAFNRAAGGGGMSSAPRSSGGGGGTLQLVVAGGADGAVATLINTLIRNDLLNVVRR